MPLNKYALIRYNALDKCFRNLGRRYYFEDLLDLVNQALFEFDPQSSGIETRQLRADISFMRSEAGYSAPIKTYRDGKKGYYQYSDQNFSINQSPLNETEAEKLKSAISILQRFEGAPQFEWVNEIIPVLRDQFDLDNNDERKVIGFDSNIDYSGYHLITEVFHAISNKRAVEISYKPFEKDEVSFLFHPHYLKQFNNRWFVFGRNENRQFDQWNVPLDRINKIQEVKFPYKENETDWEDYFYDIIGVTKGLDIEMEKVKLKVSKELAPYIQTKPLHPSQRFALNDDGSATIVIEVFPNYEMEKVILSMSDELNVIQPLWLKEKMRSRIEKALKNLK